MASVAETERLLDEILRLRRAERLPEAAADVAPVRRSLEDRLGPTLSRARAARLLGVSQTALDRWVEGGEVPTVVTPSGRVEVPSGFVVEVAEDLDEPTGAGETRHPLAAALRRRRGGAGADRDGAEGGRSAASPIPRAPEGHRTAERRSLAYHRAIAERLDEGMVGDARHRLERLAREGRIHPRYAERWRELLSLPIPELAEGISAGSEEARDLRQCSPFAAALNEHERRRIIETVR